MKIIVFTIIFFFANNLAFAEVKKDCSEKKLINKILCKTMGKSKDGKGKFGYKFDTSNPKEKKYIKDWFKKKE